VLYNSYVNWCDLDFKLSTL